MKWQDFNPDGATGEHPRGFFYRSTVSGPDGADYELLKEEHHTNVDTAVAKQYLRRNFDVVSVRVVKEE